MINVVSPLLRRAAATAAISKNNADASTSRKASSTRSKSASSTVKSKTSAKAPTTKRGRGRNTRAAAAVVSDSNSSDEDEEMERVSLESLSSNESEAKKDKNKKKKQIGTKEQKSKGGRPKSASPKPRSPQRKPGRQHRDAKPFLGSKAISGSARKLFLETETETIVYERSNFEPGRVRRPRVAWTLQEIAHLQRGVQKFGEGSWSSILQDAQLTFHPQRTQVDLKDKWRNLTSYVPYQEHAFRQFILVNSEHSEILTPTGNQHIFNNRWPRDAALKVATKDQFYMGSDDSIIIYLKESMDAIGRSERPQIVHVYRGTRTLQRPNNNIPKFAGYPAVWTGKVEKIGEELLIKPSDVLSPEEVEMKRRMKREKERNKKTSSSPA